MRQGEKQLPHRPTLLRDKLHEKQNLILLLATALVTCLATILAVAGSVTLWFFFSRHNVAETLRDKLHETFYSVTALSSLIDAKLKNQQF